MKSDELRRKELEKLRESTFFEDEVLKEIRTDLEGLLDKELINNKIIIEVNNRKILKDISINKINTSFLISSF